MNGAHPNPALSHPAGLRMNPGLVCHHRMTMQAARLYKPGDLRLEKVEPPAVGPHDVLVRVAACGVCGTDAHIMKGEFAASPPVILGHEYAGEVVEIGDAVQTLHPGDRVCVDPNMFCGTCQYCRSGKAHLCENLSALGVNVDGGFAQYSLVPETQAYPLPPGISYEQAALIEPVACCLRGIQQARIQPGDKVVVLGGGPIGLILMQLAKAAGGQVTVSEPVEEKRQLAQQLGATHTVHPDELPLEAFDVVIEAAGLAATVQQSIKVARRGANLVWFGVCPEGEKTSIEPYEVYRKELNIAGSFINPCTHKRAIELVASGAIQLEPLVSHKFPLEDIHQALAVHGEPHSNKVLVMP